MNISAVLHNAFLRTYVGVHNLFNSKKVLRVATDIEELCQVMDFSAANTDISEHLPRLFMEAYLVRPEMIVELGTRGGDSTYALSRAADLTGSRIVSVDIQDCPAKDKFKNWHFVKDDDLKFASVFRKWAGEKGFKTEIDFLFVDTSHEYEHTRQEIEAWFPLLSKRAKAVFHDTNMQQLYLRQDGSMGAGWNNQRGVIRAIEEKLGIKIDETRNFQTIVKQWRITHFATCSGLTVMEKIPDA